MRRFGKVVLIGGLALTLPVGALAADLPEPPVFHYPPPPSHESEFYLRLDLGYKIYRPPATSFDLPALG